MVRMPTKYLSVFFGDHGAPMPAIKRPSVKNATPPVRTSGRILSDGSTIQLIRDGSGEPQLSLINGTNRIVGTRIVHNKTVYELPAVKPALMRELILPTRVSSPISTRQLLAEICNVVAKFV